MKTITTNPPVAGTGDPAFIKDMPTAKPSGKAIGELVAGKREVSAAVNRRKGKAQSPEPSNARSES